MKDWEKDKRKGGFEDDPQGKPCMHREHKPPGHMVIPQGKIYRHICPGCGVEVVLRPPQVFLKAK